MTLGCGPDHQASDSDVEEFEDDEDGDSSEASSDDVFDCLLRMTQFLANGARHATNPLRAVGQHAVSVINCCLSPNHPLPSLSFPRLRVAS